MNKLLQRYSSSLLLNRKWSGHNKKNIYKKIFSISLIAPLLLISLTAFGSAEYEGSRIIDDTDYAFVDDPMVTGKWESVDYVNEPEDFIPGQSAWKRDLYLNSLVFIKDGKMLSAANGVILGPTSLTWTKGMILNKNDKTASSYEIEEIDGSSYMYYQWKTGDYSFKGMTPKFYVLKKVDSNDYSDFKPKKIMEDDVDYTFENDDRMPGNWESVDFVDNIKDFNLDKRYWPSDLCLTQMSFYSGGEMTIRTMKDGESAEFSNPSITWTSGLVVNKLNKTASKCEIKDIDGETFMFYQWKAGDYIHRGMKPSYYVLRKVN